MELKPITRKEQIVAGKDLEPITRKEMFLKQLVGGSGGNGDGSPFVYAYLGRDENRNLTCSMSYDEITAVHDAFVMGNGKPLALVAFDRVFVYDNNNDGRHRFSGLVYQNDTDLIAFSYYIGNNNIVERVKTYFDLGKIIAED